MTFHCSKCKKRTEHTSPYASKITKYFKRIHNAECKRCGNTNFVTVDK